MNNYLEAYLQDFYSLAKKKNPSLMYLFAGRVQVLQKEGGETIATLKEFLEPEKAKNKRTKCSKSLINWKEKNL